MTQPSPLLQQLQAELDAMPPVAALGVKVAGYAEGRLRLDAPLAANVNDKECAFGGSLVSLLTLAGWSLLTQRLRELALEADVYVADSQVRYLAPLYADLHAEAALAEGESWDGFVETLRQRGKARIGVVATIALPDGGIATDLSGRFVAKARA